jgi:glucan phosphoethanolaminetransferase (alkaline phosphatase superfamily)
MKHGISMTTKKKQRTDEEMAFPTRGLSTLARWLFYNVIFALIPISIAVSFRALGNKLSWNSISASPEFLFFAIMLNATALGDLSEISQALHGELTYRVLHSAILLCAIVSAIFYGCLVYEDTFQSGPLVFQERLLIVSLFLDGVSFVLTTAAEVLLARIRG